MNRKSWTTWKRQVKKTLSICSVYRHDILIFGVNFPMIYVWIKSDHIETQKKGVTALIHMCDRCVKTFQMRGVSLKRKSELLTTNFSPLQVFISQRVGRHILNYANKEKTKKNLTKQKSFHFSIKKHAFVHLALRSVLSNCSFEISAAGCREELGVKHPSSLFKTLPQLPQPRRQQGISFRLLAVSLKFKPTAMHVGRWRRF